MVDCKIMAPRGLAHALKSTLKCKLSGKGKYRGFRTIGKNVALRGLTRCLEDAIFSDGIMPGAATHGGVKRVGWKGKDGGRRRGTAVDSQISRVVNRKRSKAKPAKGLYTLTNVALATLHERRWEPVCAQRGVCDEKRRVGTALDILCYERKTNRLLVVELKTGFSGDKKLAAQKAGKPCKMHAPLSRVPDNTINRHFAQLAATREMLQSEAPFIGLIKGMDIESDIGAVLLYVNDDMAETYVLDAWWVSHAKRMLTALSH